MSSRSEIPDAFQSWGRDVEYLNICDLVSVHAGVANKFVIDPHGQLPKAA